MGYSYAKNINFDSYFMPSININSKWITDLSVRAKTKKILEKNIEGNLCDFG